MITTKPIASLSLDLDNKWSYLKTHGDPDWESFPSYLDVLVPRVLEFLGARNLIITFFVVGQDAALAKHYDLLQSIAAAGHEIGNHSFRHEPWLHLYSVKEIKAELAMAEEHIEHATGYKPVGFRGPGYSLSCALLQELIRRGYQYDASTLPNVLAPMARAYYFTTSRLTPEQKRQRRILGGTWRDGFRPNKAYQWHVDVGTLIEIPVTTMPILKLPIHVSYLLCLSAFSPILALRHFKMAVRLCRLTGVQPSLLLHPTDFLGCDDTRDLSFFPGMTMPREKKLALVNSFLQILAKHFTLVTLRQHARNALENSVLPLVEPSFRQLSNDSTKADPARDWLSSS
jgi:peptidoglycan/xylan/chitin deacetylase (PgdA/CDA1 family)